ncbi:NmrA family NAD(P)-binding protein [Nonomuraea soli]|uniref:Uncharacterized protein YbjT (DUF2867 family) n=1 Tax=Nonomuraea soli TaxID=1032476 RepID=A0A7W0CR20_9ACTN|nr:NmrA family NAD(P)-binding protein [Nonomuraea soli]MBA2895619.1 uncharacterized protein YbjT (DUF2867 family) [Nonomuraea soli]
MTILVTGATGTVGRSVVEQLVARGEKVRALTRDPAAASFPDGVEVARGDLSDPAGLAPAFEGVTAVHLYTLNGTEALETGAEIVALAVKAGVRRATVLSSWEENSVEEALRASDLPWTQLQGVEFMNNAYIDWADSIAAEGVVRVFGNQPSAVVHEADIAAVAVAALTGPGHEGEVYMITGPEALTTEERVRILGRAMGRELRFEQLTEQQLRDQMASWGAEPDYIEFAVQLGLNMPEAGKTVLPTVEAVTGRPARTFARWAAENADRFRDHQVQQAAW